jgi:hypothetical protein
MILLRRCLESKNIVYTRYWLERRDQPSILWSDFVTTM